MSPKDEKIQPRYDDSEVQALVVETVMRNDKIKQVLANAENLIEQNNILAYTPLYDEIDPKVAKETITNVVTNLVVEVSKKNPNATPQELLNLTMAAIRSEASKDNATLTSRLQVLSGNNSAENDFPEQLAENREDLIDPLKDIAANNNDQNFVRKSSQIVSNAEQEAETANQIIEKTDQAISAAQWYLEYGSGAIDKLPNDGSKQAEIEEIKRRSELARQQFEEAKKLMDDARNIEEARLAQNKALEAQNTGSRIYTYAKPLMDELENDVEIVDEQLPPANVEPETEPEEAVLVEAEDLDSPAADDELDLDSEPEPDVSPAPTTEPAVSNSNLAYLAIMKSDAFKEVVVGGDAALRVIDGKKNQVENGLGGIFADEEQKQALADFNYQDAKDQLIAGASVIMFQISKDYLEPNASGELDQSKLDDLKTLFERLGNADAAGRDKILGEELELAKTSAGRAAIEKINQAIKNSRINPFEALSENSSAYVEQIKGNYTSLVNSDPKITEAGFKSQLNAVRELEQDDWRRSQKLAEDKLNEEQDRGFQGILNALSNFMKDGNILTKILTVFVSLFTTGFDFLRATKNVENVELAGVDVGGLAFEATQYAQLASIQNGRSLEANTRMTIFMNSEYKLDIPQDMDNVYAYKERLQKFLHKRIEKYREEGLNEDNIQDRLANDMADYVDGRNAKYEEVIASDDGSIYIKKVDGKIYDEDGKEVANPNEINQVNQPLKLEGDFKVVVSQDDVDIDSGKITFNKKEYDLGGEYFSLETDASGNPVINEQTDKYIVKVNPNFFSSDEIELADGQAQKLAEMKQSAIESARGMAANGVSEDALLDSQLNERFNEMVERAAELYNAKELLASKNTAGRGGAG